MNNKIVHKANFKHAMEILEILVQCCQCEDKLLKIINKISKNEIRLRVCTT